MTSITGLRSARIAGATAGVALAALALWVSRPVAGERAVGSAVSFAANLTGELAVSPAGPAPFLRESAMRPGEPPASGEFTLTNQTGERLAIRLAAVPSSPAIDEVLEVRLSTAGTELRAGPVGSLRRPGGAPIVLEPGGSASVHVSASLPAGAPPGWEAAVAEVAIRFQAGDAGAG